MASFDGESATICRWTVFKLSCPANINLRCAAKADWNKSSQGWSRELRSQSVEALQAQ